MAAVARPQPLPRGWGFFNIRLSQENWRSIVALILIRYLMPAIDAQMCKEQARMAPTANGAPII